MGNSRRRLALTCARENTVRQPWRVAFTFRLM